MFRLVLTFLSHDYIKLNHKNTHESPVKSEWDHPMQEHFSSLEVFTWQSLLDYLSHNLEGRTHYCGRF